MDSRRASQLAQSLHQKPGELSLPDITVALQRQIACRAAADYNDKLLHRHSIKLHISFMLYIFARILVDFRPLSSAASDT